MSNESTLNRRRYHSITAARRVALTIARDEDRTVYVKKGDLYAWREYYLSGSPRSARWTRLIWGTDEV